MFKGKEVTIYDLADRLNLSIATVSRALKDDPVVSRKTKRKIIDLAEKMGYRSNHFASNLRKQKTNTIGIIIHELNSNFITSVLAGVEKITAEAGYDLIIAHSSERYVKEAANAKNLFHKRVDGLIASLSFDTNDLEHFRPFEEKGVPVIFFDRVERSSKYAAVVIDNYKCGYQATEHLIEQGCKRIVHVMEMYNVHQDAALIPIEITSGDYSMGDKKLKAVSASASRDKNGTVHISLTNIDAHNSQDVTIDISSLKAKTVTGRILQSPKLQDHNSFDDPMKIKPVVFKGANISGPNLSLKMPPFSVVVLELK